ncbi:MAG TPA: helix-turn-helix transcriptional regulator [Paludibacter sp.]|nr:helix-turn-helix transcriptional regulator [Paludibacter sp.]
MKGFNHLKINSLVEDYQNTHKRVTIDQLAKLIGISKATLDKVRKGETEPKASTLYLIAIFFKVSIDSFFEFEENVKEYVSKNYESSIFEKMENYESFPEGNPWKICFEQQKEITELKVERERYRNENASVQDAAAV